MEMMHEISVERRHRILLACLDKFPDPAAAPVKKRKNAKGVARGKRRTWTDERWTQLHRLVVADTPPKKIAEEMGISVASVYERKEKLRRRQVLQPPATKAPAPPPAALPDPAPENEPVTAERRAVSASVVSVITWLRSRDIHVTPIADVRGEPRWEIDGYRDQAFNKTALLSYANEKRRQLGLAEFAYGV